MNTIAIEIDGAKREFTTPENWEECSNQQLMRIWNTYNQPDGNVVLFQQLCLVYDLMAFPCRGEKKMGPREIARRKKFIVDAFDGMVDPTANETEQEHQLAVRGTVIFELLQSMEFMKQPLLLHTSRCPWLLGWRGFSTQLEGMCVEQFALANVKMSAFIESKDEQDLNDLVGVLYRPFFMPWLNRFHLIEIYAWLAGKLLPLKTRLRMMMMWKGHLDFMLSNFPELSRDRESEPNPYGWESTFVGLAGDKFGSYTEVKRADILPALINLEEHAKRQREMEEELEKNKK